MTKSQFNIKISKDLLTQVKSQATRLGKTLTEHITDLVTKSLSDNDLLNNNFEYLDNLNDLATNNAVSLDDFKDLDKRLLHIESIVGNREYVSERIKPFSNSEAINCTEFMRGVFLEELTKRNFESKSEAFHDLYKHIENYDQLAKNFFDRLEEILTSDNPNPWTGNELNELTGSSKCNCAIRKGLITWVGKINFPSQQEICERGEELLPLI